MILGQRAAIAAVVILLNIAPGRGIFGAATVLS
jgi:hypothetical protein